MEQEKKEIKENLHQRVEDIEQQIEKESAELARVQYAQDHLNRLKKNLDRCAELLSSSLENGIAKTRFDNLVLEGNKNYVKTSSGFDEQTVALKRKISDLDIAKEQTIREYEREKKERED